MSAPYARFFTPPLHGGSFPLPRARDVVKTSVFTRPRKRDISTSASLSAVMICSGVCRLLPIADLPVAATRCRILTSALVSFQGVTLGALLLQLTVLVIELNRSIYLISHVGALLP